MRHKAKHTLASSRRTQQSPSKFRMASVTSAVVAVVALLYMCLLPKRQTSSFHILPNGGGAAVEVDGKAWQDTLHSYYPDARRIGLWDAFGNERAWSERGSTVSTSGNLYQSSDASLEQLYAVVDEFPFVWPASEMPHMVDVGDGRVELRTLAERPRAFMADGVLSEEECAAIQRLGEPLLKGSVNYIGGASHSNAARTSDSGWMDSKALLTARAVGMADDVTAFMRVKRRLSSLARVHVEAAESMQIIRYQAGQHYHYHTDTGGSSQIAGRAITVLVYLNDDFEGGQTSFPTSGMGSPMNNVYKVRERYANCTTSEGLVVTPKRGSVLLFYNLESNTQSKDWFTWHGSCEISHGVKYAANLWFHLGLMTSLHQRGLRPLSWPAVAEAAEAAACEDSHHSDMECTAWAKSGQCSTNSGFMLAKCRHSCGACGL